MSVYLSERILSSFNLDFISFIETKPSWSLSNYLYVFSKDYVPKKTFSSNFLKILRSSLFSKGSLFILGLAVYALLT